MIWRIVPVRTLVLVAGDAAALVASVVSAIALRSVVGESETPFGVYLAAWPALAVMLLLLAFRRLYRSIPYAAHEELRHITLSLTLGFGLLGTLVFLSGQAATWSRSILVLSWGLSLVLVPAVRWSLRTGCMRSRWWSTNCLILGAGATGRLVAERLLSHPWIGLKPVGFLDDDPALQGQSLHGIPVLGALSNTAEAAGKLKIDTAIVAMPGASADRLSVLERSISRVFPRLVLIPSLVGFVSTELSAHDLGGVVGISARRQLLMPIPRFFKRVLDLIMIVILLVPVGALIVLLALLIRVSSPGPVFYRQARLGLGGRSFVMLKFRTMEVDADKRLSEMLASDPLRRSEYEKFHKLRDDPRVTMIGRFLRMTSLDELPQYWNVLRGEMSFVGPRAYLVGESEKLGHHAEIILGVRPGITGLWQVSGRSDISFVQRVEMEQHYVRMWSVWLDIIILARTMAVLFRMNGAR